MNIIFFFVFCLLTWKSFKDVGTDAEVYFYYFKDILSENFGQNFEQKLVIQIIGNTNLKINRQLPKTRKTYAKKKKSNFRNSVCFGITSSLVIFNFTTKLPI